MNSYKNMLINHLNEFSFRTIWNETTAEYRVNAALIPITRNYSINSIANGIETLKTPIADTQFIVLKTPIQVFSGGLNILNNRWLSAVDILDTNQILLYVYGTEGRLIPREHIYVFKSAVSNWTYVAISKKVISSIFNNSNISDIYMTLYRNSKSPKLTECKTYHANKLDSSVGTEGLSDYLDYCKNKNSSGTSVFINGYEVDHNLPITFTKDDYIEILCDDNVIGTYDVNVSNNTTGYFSKTTNKYRDIIHCPKIINPDNKLITQNTCTMSIFTPNNKGAYLHRTDTDSVSQITHNDISVSTDVIDSFRDIFDEMDLIIRVRVRAHESDNVLISELFYITYLYQCDDETIVRHLRGNIDSNLYFWNANKLENSTYTRLMYNTPNTSDTSVLDAYVSGLGYHTVAAILAPTVFHSALKKDQNIIKIIVPLALRGREIFPIVYLNGVKLLKEKYTHSQTNSSGVFSIYLNNTTHVPPNSTVSIVTVEDGKHFPYMFKVNAAHTLIDIKHRGVLLYEEMLLDNPITFGKDVYTKSYREIKLSPGELEHTVSENKNNITASAKYYDKTLLIQNKHYAYIHDFNIDDEINVNKGAILKTLTTSVFGDVDMIVPLIGFNSIDVYMNGKYLLPDMDYMLHTVKDTSGNIVQHILSINSVDYIDYKNVGNTLSVVAHTGKTISKEHGFTFDGKISYDANINIWHRNLSRCFVKGKLLVKPIDNGTYLTPDTPTLNGDPYGILVTLPSSISEVLEGYDRNANINRLAIIKAYFKRTIDIDKSFIIINKSHLIFSTYLSEIIKDILNKTLIPVNDPDDNLFMLQFSKYEYLKELDPTLLTGDKLIDRRYSDMRMTYVNDFTSPDTNIHEIIHRIGNLTLPKDVSSLGDILNG